MNSVAATVGSVMSCRSRRTVTRIWYVAGRVRRRQIAATYLRLLYRNSPAVLIDLMKSEQDTPMLI